MVGMRRRVHSPSPPDISYTPATSWVSCVANTFPCKGAMHITHSPALSVPVVMAQRGVDQESFRHQTLLLLSALCEARCPHHQLRNNTTDIRLNTRHPTRLKGVSYSVCARNQQPNLLSVDILTEQSQSRTQSPCRPRLLPPRWCLVPCPRPPRRGLAAYSSNTEIVQSCQSAQGVDEHAGIRQRSSWAGSGVGWESRSTGVFYIHLLKLAGTDERVCNGLRCAPSDGN